MFDLTLANRRAIEAARRRNAKFKDERRETIDKALADLTEVSDRVAGHGLRIETKLPRVRARGLHVLIYCGRWQIVGWWPTSGVAVVGGANGKRLHAESASDALQLAIQATKRG